MFNDKSFIVGPSLIQYSAVESRSVGFAVSFIVTFISTAVEDSQPEPFV